MRSEAVPSIDSAGCNVSQSPTAPAPALGLENCSNVTASLDSNSHPKPMGDRLIALGMRRPTRVKDEDYDVPTLTEDDFEIEPLPDHISIISRECTLARDVEVQRGLAQMCIAKAKLCLCISHVLSAMLRPRPMPRDSDRKWEHSLQCNVVP